MHFPPESCLLSAGSPSSCLDPSFLPTGIQFSVQSFIFSAGFTNPAATAMARSASPAGREPVKAAQKRKSARNQEAALEPAREIFAKNGFLGASADMIAEHAGYSKGAVYSNFENKGALFLKLLKERMSEEIGELRALLSRSGSAEEIMQVLEEK
jgi:AcrR family transcriptional regulator